MTKERLSLGAEGELFAAGYLKKIGYRIMALNYTSPAGEIDIIALDGETLVFIEVKTRKDRSYGFPFEAVHGRKQGQIIRTAQHYLLKKKLKNRPVRFDVLSLISTGNSFEAEHIRSAFESPPF